MLTGHALDFNDTLSSCIEDTIVDGLDRTVLNAICEVLKTKYDVTRDEFPYRTGIIYQILETDFNVQGARTIGISIARRFYLKLGLSFHEHEGYMLSDYVEDAKSKLAK
jgi:hypothetical protein